MLAQVYGAATLGGRWLSAEVTAHHRSGSEKREDGALCWIPANTSGSGGARKLCSTSSGLGQRKQGSKTVLDSGTRPRTLWILGDHHGGREDVGGTPASEVPGGPGTLVPEPPGVSRLCPEFGGLCTVI